jgi:hypothetical protein
MHYAQYMETEGKTTEWLLSNTVTQCYFLPCSSTKNDDFRGTSGTTIDNEDRKLASMTENYF